MSKPLRKLGGKKNYTASFKSIWWGIIGLIVSYYMIKGPLAVVGYALGVLSVLMFVLAGWQAYNTS